MVAAVSTIARRVEAALLEYAGRRELALLHDYRTACARNRGPVFALSNDVVMLNDSARRLIDPRDQAQLLALAAEALAARRPRDLTLTLLSGAGARLHCKPSWTDSPVVGGVVMVELFAPVPRPGPALPPIATHGPVRGMVGEGALWSKCRQEVEAQFHTREWLLLEGEPGVGKLTLVRATHLAHTPEVHLRVFEADEAVTAADGGGAWLDAVRDDLVGARGTVILRHVDRLPEPVLEALADLIGLIGAITPDDSATRPWLVATRVGSGPADGPLARLVERFPHTVEVPPLRYHVEDVRELVPFLIARLTRGSALSCSPEAMRVLLRNRWPGNVEQLHQVVRKIVAHRRTGVIVPADLPADAQATSRRVLTPLESIECDAIVACLHSVDGNRAEAARHLGMSRATIYRKIRDYGIVVPPSKSG
jgi:transcriptional regulator of acetoin/glycerol metabolism